MAVMQKIIQFINDSGLSQAVYDGFGFLGILVAVIFGLWYGGKIQIKRWITLTVVIVTQVVAFFSIHVIIPDALWYIMDRSSVMVVFTTTITRTLCLFPMIALFMSKVMRVEWAKLCDMLAFIPLLIGGIGAFGCIFAGCCRGYPCAFGIYNYQTGSPLFPVQLLNAAIMGAIVIYLYRRSKKNGYFPDGTLYPIMLMLFGSTRFLTEFLCDNTKVIMGCSVIGFHSLKDCVIGIIVFFWIRYHRIAKQ